MWRASTGEGAEESVVGSHGQGIKGTQEEERTWQQWDMSYIQRN